MATAASRIVLVTGANKGLGLEAVRILSQRLPPGSTVLLGSRSVSNGEKAIERLRQSSSTESTSTSTPNPNANVQIHVVPIDITSPTSLSTAVQTIREKYGKIDVLISNSGISEVDGDENSPEIFNVNVRGARACIEAFAPLVPAGAEGGTDEGKGTIILTSSVVGPMYMSLLPATTRSMLDDVQSVTWETVEEWMDDWMAQFHNTNTGGDKTRHEWAEPNPPFTEAYYVSKALVNAWARSYALRHPERRFAFVCPGYCATELNHFKGTRPASMGGESIVWPVFNGFEHGHLYQDGKDLPFIQELPKW